MNQNERIVYVEKRGMSIWGAIGWLLFFGLLFLVWKAVSTVNDVAGIFDTTAATLEAINAPEFQQQPGVVILSTSTPFPSGLTNFITDTDDDPSVVNKAPIQPTQGLPTQEPEAIINYSEILAQPAATAYPLSKEQLLACLSAQNEGRRMAPYCPTNAAELLGPGR